MIKYQSTLMKCKLVNDKECIWNGCFIRNGTCCYVVTTLAMILLSLPCKNLKNTFSQKLKNLSTFFLNVSVSIHSISSSNDLHKFSAKFVTAWKSKQFYQVIKKIRFSSEMLPSDNRKSDKEAKFCCDLHRDDELLSWFGIFSVENSVFSTSMVPVNFAHIQQGMAVLTNSFPFGDSNKIVFHNCVSKGILCNIIDDVFLLIDACCLPGTHGALVHCKNFNPLGIVICPLELKTGQLTGMTVVCSWEEVFSSFTLQLAQPNTTLVNKLTFKKINSNCLSKDIEVVFLRHSNGWGSGVIVMLDELNKKVFVATCRHVVEPAKEKVLKANFFCGTKMHVTKHAKIVYSTKKKSWLDFALLEVNCDCSLFSKIHQRTHNFLVKSGQIYVIKYACHYRKGTSVFSKGFCLFDTSAFMPTVTNGVLSNVVYSKSNDLISKDSPILLHSNCTVLDGISGGSVFSLQEHTFYGLVVNNIKEHFEDEKYILYQNVNFVLPASVFMPTISNYISGNFDFSVLHHLSYDDDYQKTWLVSTEKPCMSKL